jgi:Transglutaminase-like superfamily/Coenzyme PQQ synthesis protein D (PqqD)
MLTVWRPPAKPEHASASALSLAPDVVFVQLEDGSARILDMGSGFYSLPALGARMLRGVLERDLAATVQELAGEFESPPDQMRADVEALLTKLRQRELLATGGRRKRSRRGLGLLLGPCLLAIRGLPLRCLQAAALLVLAYLCFALFGWARTVRCWQRCARRFAPDRSRVDPSVLDAVDRAVRDLAASLPVPGACKERALSCWTLAHWAGQPATLVVGLDLFPLAGHCWCECGTRTLSDDAERCALFTPILQYS